MNKMEGEYLTTQTAELLHKGKISNFKRAKALRYLTKMYNHINILDKEELSETIKKTIDILK